ncbi:MAG: kinase [Verrucomicrobiae bacterium]|nr:kinase [Verrucomicrobiae bacterium]
MIITRTPFRVSFFGGGTDYEPYYSRHGGVIVGASFHRYCYITCRPLPPFFEYKTRVAYSLIECVNEPREIKHPSIRGCLTYLGVRDGLQIHHEGDLPARSGLGSSSAFTVGMLLALHTLRHEMPTRRMLADQAIEVEQKVIGENVGIQDQILAAHGGMQVIDISPNGDYEVSPMILPPDYHDALEQHVLLGFTGLTRNATELAGAQIKMLKDNTSTMREIHDIARRALELFRQRAEFSKIGELLDASWRVKRTLANGLSNDSIDQMYEAARKAGAFGGKLMGAGGGGFVMFLAPPYRHLQIQEALPGIRVWVPFRFEKGGAQVIFHTDEQ